MDRSDAFFDVPRLVALRQLVRTLDPSGPPQARFLLAADASGVSRLALLPGSFNPPTTAHVALAEAVLRTGSVDRVDFLLATRTVDKERLEGATLPDRLILLQELESTRPGLGVVVVNRGLYVDQAEIIRATLPYLVDLWFVVGFDKIVQIFDPRYYDDRDAALDRLFSLARILVAPRGTADTDDLATLLVRSENRRFADRVQGLDLHPAYRQISSSRLRAHDPSAFREVPAIVNQFIRETGAYGVYPAPSSPEPADRYRVREEVLDLAETGAVSVHSGEAFRAAIDNLIAAGDERDRREDATL